MVHVTFVMCYTGIEVHCTGTSWSEWLVHLGLKVFCTWVADEVQSHVHASLWRSAHFMSSVSPA